MLRGDWAGAAKLRREILERRVETLGQDHWRVTDARLDLQDVEARGLMTADQRRRLDEADRLQTTRGEFSRKGAYKEATLLGRRIVAIREEILGEHNSAYVTSLMDLASLLRSQGDLAAARPLMRKLWRSTRRSLASTIPTSLGVSTNWDLFSFPRDN